MSVYVGSARIDERGKVSGGQAGDQTGKEVAYQAYYVHSKGWYVLRAKNATHRTKIAYAMKAACDNDKIGYDQSNRNGLYNAVKSKGFDPAKCTVATETDCSGLVRVCVSYATRKTIPDFNTESELKVLSNTGLFDVYKDSAHCSSSANLMNGDILVTRTKGHTVVVISGAGESSANASTGSNSSSSVLKKGSKGEAVKTLQRNLNTAINAGLSVDGDFGSGTDKAVRNFQSKYGLSVDGAAGPATQKKLAEVIASKNSSSSSSSSLLKKGSKGDAVKTLQKNLNTAIGAGLSVDGDFGSGTEKAVKNFQSKYGLSADGIAGPATQKKLAEVIANKKNVVVATPTLRKGSKGENVKTLQRNLNAAIGAGLAVDGSYGPACYAAVKKFQSKYGLGADGIYGPNTAAKMKAVL